MRCTHGVGITCEKQSLDFVSDFYVLVLYIDFKVRFSKVILESTHFFPTLWFIECTTCNNISHLYPWRRFWSPAQYSMYSFFVSLIIHSWLLWPWSKNKTKYIHIYWNIHSNCRRCHQPAACLIQYSNPRWYNVPWLYMSFINPEFSLKCKYYFRIKQTCFQSS